MQNTYAPHLDLLAEILAFIDDDPNMSKSAFGTAAVGDPSFVTDLEKNGREPRSRLVIRAREFMATGITHEQAKAAATEPAQKAG